MFQLLALDLACISPLVDLFAVRITTILSCSMLLPVQGVQGHGFYDNLVVPIIENTARECELTDRLRQAMKVRQDITL